MRNAVNQPEKGCRGVRTPRNNRDARRVLSHPYVNDLRHSHHWSDKNNNVDYFIKEFFPSVRTGIGLNAHSFMKVVMSVYILRHNYSNISPRFISNATTGFSSRQLFSTFGCISPMKPTGLPFTIISAVRPSMKLLWDDFCNLYCMPRFRMSASRYEDIIS